MARLHTADRLASSTGILDMTPIGTATTRDPSPHHTQTSRTVTLVTPYGGIPRPLVKQVFKIAHRLRFQRPSAAEVARLSRTSLDEEIVSAILEGALRLLPPDNSPGGTVTRRTEAAEKAARAQRAESDFLDRMRVGLGEVLTEAEQKAGIKLARDRGQPVINFTPDMLFPSPTLICGVLCCWVEYKNTFGFRDSPFVASKHKSQIKKYASQLGAGMVVFKLGFEHAYIQIPGVVCFREAEVLQWLSTFRPSQ